MPYGSTNGGDGPAFGGGTPPTQQQITAQTGDKKIKERVHSLSYSETVNKLLLDVDVSQTEGFVKADTVGDITIRNSGNTPAFAILAYRLWTAEGTMSTESDGSTATGVYHVHYLLKPGQSLFIPDSPAIISDAEVTQFDGTATVVNAVPSSNMYADISTVSSGFDNTTDPVTIASADGDFWRVGDMVRCNAEVVEITGISTDNLTVKRGMLGTSAASHSDSETLRLQFSNDYHDIDKFSVCQTDAGGKFKASNFFGQGRAAGIQGLTPGSFAIKFYQPGYQNLTNSGDITSSTNSGLTASTEYKLDITVDGGTLFQDLTITTDSSNLNFGGTNGIISKLQEALDTQYYTAGNLFEKKVHVGIVNGDVRFTSGSHLSTSAMLIADTGDSGTLIDAAANGRIPAAASIPSAIAARLPDDVIYDPITYTSVPNTGAFGYDDGYGRIFGMCTGSINYETGAIDISGCPPNAEFVITCLHSSPFSGKQDATDSLKMNKLKHIYVNVPNQKWNGELTIIRS